MSNDGETPIALGSEADLVIQGLPVGHGVRSVSFRPTGGALAFVLRPQKSSPHLELWWAEFDPALSSAEQPPCVAQRVPLDQNTILHGVFGVPFSWTVDGRLLVKVVPQDTAANPPTKPLAPTGPSIEDSDGSAKKAARE